MRTAWRDQLLGSGGVISRWEWVIDEGHQSEYIEGIYWQKSDRADCYNIMGRKEKQRESCNQSWKREI